MSKIRMTEQMKSNWIAALESGDFKYGKVKFRNTIGGYCALGVLCAISGIPVEYWDEDELEFVDNYNGLEKLYGFEQEGYMKFHKIYGRSDDGKNSFAPVIEFLKNEVECTDVD